VDKTKVIIDAEQRFGVAEKEIGMRQKVIVEVLDHALLAGAVKVDQHVAAEDDV
jgi:hypothetical protein